MNPSSLGQIRAFSGFSSRQPGFGADQGLFWSKPHSRAEKGQMGCAFPLPSSAVPCPANGATV